MIKHHSPIVGVSAAAGVSDAFVTLRLIFSGTLNLLSLINLVGTKTRFMDRTPYRQVASPVPDSALSRYVAALISARCVNAWGKFPRCRPSGPSSSEYRPR